METTKEQALDTLGISKEEYKELIKKRRKDFQKKTYETVNGEYTLNLGKHTYVISNFPFQQKEGKKFVTQKDGDIANRMIAMIICNDFKSTLNFAEFFFLCDVAGEKHKYLADELGISSATLSKWKKMEQDYPSKEFSRYQSRGLKISFIEKLFMPISEVFRLENTEVVEKCKFLVDFKSSAA